MTNLSLVRVVVYFLGAAVLVAVGGIIACALTGHPVPDVLQNLAVGTLTGLAGILAKPSNEPTQVTVADQPVAVTPTEDAPARKRARSRT